MLCVERFITKGYFLLNRLLQSGDLYSTSPVVFRFLVVLSLDFLQPVLNKNGMIMNIKLYPRLLSTHRIESSHHDLLDFPRGIYNNFRLYKSY